MGNYIYFFKLSFILSGNNATEVYNKTPCGLKSTTPNKIIVYVRARKTLTFTNN